MFAVIKSGGKQYKVAPNDILRVEKLDAAPGEIITLDSVLMVGAGDDLNVGTPLVAGAAVAAEVIEQARAPKIIVFKKERRKNHRRRKGHRQQLTVLRVTEILTDGQAPSKPAKATPAKDVAKDAEPAPAADAAAVPKAAAKKPEAKTETKKAPAKKAAPKKAATEKTPAKKPAAKKAAAKKAPEAKKE